MNIIMKCKAYLIFIIIVICKVIVFAQNNNSRYIEKGSCKDVFNYLQKMHGNDSITIEIFKKKYGIYNISDSLFRKNYIEIIQYFNSEEGEKCFCRLRVIKIRPSYPLLMDPSKLSSDKWLIDDK